MANEHLEERAIAAYWRAGATNGSPSFRHTNEVKRGGKRYLAVCDEKSVLAVYRVRNDGMLKRLKRWPEDLYSP